MGLEERVYSVLVVSAAERFNAALSEMLPQSLFSPVRFVRGVSIAKQAIAERDFDLVLLYAPLPDDPGVEFAAELCTTAGTVVLLLMRPELYAATRDEAAESGVFSLSLRRCSFAQMDFPSSPAKSSCGASGSIMESCSGTGAGLTGSIGSARR